MESLNPEQLLAVSNFYEQENIALSPSALKLLMTSPEAYYKKYALKEEEKVKKKFFDEGSLLHALVLQPDEVADMFVNMVVSAPPDSAKTLCDYLLDLNDLSDQLEMYEEQILTYLAEINLHQSLVDDKKAPFKTGDEKRLEKVITENAILYFELMHTNKDKIIVDNASWEKCIDKKDAILKSPYAKKLLLIDGEKQEISKELLLTNKHDGINYTLKGILDCIKVDRINKKIYVTDLKTTSASLKEFVKSVETHGYWLQGAIYYLLAHSLTQGTAMNYEIVVNFLVVDGKNQVYNFEVSSETMESWLIRSEEVINVQFEYHYKNKDFTLPYSFANNLITL